MHRRYILPILILLILTSASSGTHAQMKNFVLTADSLSTGNYKDVFKSFFQLAFDRFTSEHKEIRFTSNPFAIMARADTNLLIDTSYLRYKALRNFNFAFSAKLDSDFKFNGFSSGITYALVNRRDETVSKYFLAKAFDANNEFNILRVELTSYVSTIPELEKKILINTQIESFFDGTKTFNELDSDLQEEIGKIANRINALNLIKLLSEDPKLNIHNLIVANYDSVKTDFQNRLLITVSLSDTTYQDQFMFSNLVASTNVVKGITKRNRVFGLELNLRAAYQYLDDTVLAGRDLKRQLFLFEPGLNLVVKTKRTQYPWAELKLTGAYTSTNRPFENQPRELFTMNGTLRIRVFDDVWIPLELRYDPKSGNVFGFLNVRANFSGFKNE